MKHPNGELVGQAWLIAYAGVDVGKVASKLPNPVESPWPEDGFVQVRALVGASTEATLPERRTSVLQVDTWGTRQIRDRDVFRPLWAVAMDLAECIRVATFPGVQEYGKPLTMPVADYSPARVLVGSLLSEPTRVEDDPSGYARMTLNLSLTWTV